MSPAAPLGTLHTIQLVRGAAALLVVSFHAGSIDQFYLQHDFIGGFFMFGFGGVDVFFVLSGVVIGLAHGVDLERPERVRSYLTRRFVRIYPVFWIVAIVLVPIYFGVPRHARDGVVLLRSLLLLNPSDNVAVTVGWSLAYEIFFYVLFALAIWLPWKYSRWLLTLWLVSSALAYVAILFSGGMLALPPGGAFLLSPYNLEFGMGCAVAAALRQGRSVNGLMLTLAGGTMFLVSAVNEPFLHRHFGQRHSIVCYGVSSMLVIWGAVDWERRASVRIPRALLVLGDASYSIYLTHYALLDLLAKGWLASGFAPVVGPVLAMPIILALAVAVGIAFYWHVERPLLARLRERSEERIFKT